MKTLFKIFIVASLLLPLSINCLAKGGGEHITDMFMVYPFYAGDDSPFSTFYKSIQAAIDYQTFDPKDLTRKNTGHPIFTQKEPFTQTRWANHRIWYHWGFNKDPRKYKPLSDLVARNIREGLMSEDDKYTFYDRLITEWTYRNRELMKISAAILGYDYDSMSSAMRSQVNAFVTIPYCVHLLGDHFADQKEKEIILQMNLVVGDIYQAIDNLAGKSKANQEKALLLKSKLKRYEDSPENFLAALEEYFSEYLLSLSGELYDYRNKFKKLGYKPRPGSGYKF